jgi:L-asparaginase
MTKILLIYTGGTIGMLQDEITGTLKPVDFNNLVFQIPELKKFDYVLDIDSSIKPIDSSDMSPEVWQQLATIIENNYNNYDGFVVLHGSDTMAYTASALSFMVQNLSKPVILTGSQLPIGTIRTDAKENLITAIEIAASKTNGQATVPEVAIYFEYQLYRGNRTHKYNAEQFEAFRSPNYPVLAEAGVHLKFNSNNIAKASSEELKIYKKLDTNIVVLHLYPGIPKKVVEATLQIEGLKAVVLKTYGSGNASTQAWFITALETAIQKKIFIVNVTQCNAGLVEQGKYATSKQLQKIGVLSGADITTEAAITKLMHLLANYTHYEIKRKFTEPLTGEMSI